ncbi:MAG TPA: AmmeMemoRadiSam system protein B [Candidatus Acidoferrum sp.]|jgi:AmmeMemoRadiSam system protein B
MIRLPAVAGQFYPANPRELSSLIHRFLNENGQPEKERVSACLVPHAGYIYSGHVAAAVFSRIKIPTKVLILGVRHQPLGEALAIVSHGHWRTPLGDVSIDRGLAMRLRAASPALQEDEVAHSREHSLEVELPFLQVLQSQFTFVPVALGTTDLEELLKVGEGVAEIVGKAEEEVLIVTSSDMNHYEDEGITRRKDQRAIECMERLDARGLYDVCRRERISMCGLGPAIVMLSAVKKLGVKRGELIRYATSGEISGEHDSVVGYAGMIFR